MDSEMPSQDHTQSIDSTICHNDTQTKDYNTNLDDIRREVKHNLSLHSDLLSYINSNMNPKKESALKNLLTDKEDENERISDYILKGSTKRYQRVDSKKNYINDDSMDNYTFKGTITRNKRSSITLIEEDIDEKHEDTPLIDLDDAYLLPIKNEIFELSRN